MVHPNATGFALVRSNLTPDVKFGLPHHTYILGEMSALPAGSQLLATNLWDCVVKLRPTAPFLEGQLDNANSDFNSIVFEGPGPANFSQPLLLTEVPDSLAVFKSQNNLGVAPWQNYLMLQLPQVRGGAERPELLPAAAMPPQALASSRQRRRRCRRRCADDVGRGPDAALLPLPPAGVPGPAAVPDRPRGERRARALGCSGKQEEELWGEYPPSRPPHRQPPCPSLPQWGASCIDGNLAVTAITDNSLANDVVTGGHKYEVVIDVVACRAFSGAVNFPIALGAVSS